MNCDNEDINCNYVKKAKDKKDDEFITNPLHVKRVFEFYLADVDFSGKSIYCFCDSDESEFVKYLKANKSRLNYSELYYTSDDYNTHEDLFEKADYIITNPPFSKIVKEIIPKLKKYNKKYFLFGSNYNIPSYYTYLQDDPDFRIIDSNCKPCSSLIGLNDGNIEKKFNVGTENEKSIHTVYFTNIKEARENEVKNLIYPFVNKFEDIPHNYMWINKLDGEKITALLIDKMRDIPGDYDDYLAVPTSIYFSYNARYFNIFCNKSYENRWKISSDNYSDGKRRFIRVFCKIKPEYLNK